MKLNLSQFTLVDPQGTAIYGATLLAGAKTSPFVQFSKEGIYLIADAEMEEVACELLEISTTGMAARWKPQNNKVNLLAFEVTVDTPGINNEITLASILVHDQATAAEIFWIDKLADGNGEVYMRCREYAGRHTTAIKLGDLKRGEKGYIELNMDNKCVVTGALNHVPHSFQINKPSYREYAMLFSVGPRIEAGDDDQASVLLSSLLAHHGEEVPVVNDTEPQKVAYDARKKRRRK